MKITVEKKYSFEERIELAHKTASTIRMTLEMLYDRSTIRFFEVPVYITNNVNGVPTRLLQSMEYSINSRGKLGIRGITCRIKAHRSIPVMHALFLINGGTRFKIKTLAYSIFEGRCMSNLNEMVATAEIKIPHGHS